MSTIFLTISVLFFLANKGGNCQADELNDAIWMQGKDTEKEYLFDNSTKRNFYEARDFCFSLKNGATLPMIKNYEENAAVFSMISHFSLDPHLIHVWLGANQGVDAKRERKFLWFDGSGMRRGTTDFTNWIDGHHPYYNEGGIILLGRQGSWLNAGHHIKWRTTICERLVKKDAQNEEEEEKPIIVPPLLEKLLQKMQTQNGLIGRQITRQSDSLNRKLEVLKLKLEKLAGNLAEKRRKAKEAAEKSFQLYALLRNHASTR